MKNIIKILLTSTLLFALNAVAFDDEFNFEGKTMEEVFAMDNSDPNDEFAFESDFMMNNDDEFEINDSYQQAFKKCRMHHSYEYCKAWFEGFAYARDGYKRLLDKYNGNQSKACYELKRHYNESVKYKHSVPFRKGYVFFGMEQAHCR